MKVGCLGAGKANSQPKKYRADIGCPHTLNKPSGSANETVRSALYLTSECRTCSIQVLMIAKVACPRFSSVDQPLYTLVREYQLLISGC